MLMLVYIVSVQLSVLNFFLYRFLLYLMPSAVSMYLLTSLHGEQSLTISSNLPLLFVPCLSCQFYLLLYPLSGVLLLLFFYYLYAGEGDTGHMHTPVSGIGSELENHVSL